MIPISRSLRKKAPQTSLRLTLFLLFSFLQHFFQQLRFTTTTVYLVIHDTRRNTFLSFIAVWITRHYEIPPSANLTMLCSAYNFGFLTNITSLSTDACRFTASVSIAKFCLLVIPTYYGIIHGAPQCQGWHTLILCYLKEKMINTLAKSIVNKC